MVWHLYNPLWCVAVAVSLLATFQPSDCVGHFRVAIHYWNHKGSTCDAGDLFHWNKPCDPRFELIIQQNGDPALLHRKQGENQYVRNVDFVAFANPLFADPIGPVNNPVTVTVKNTKKPVTVRFIMYDHDGYVVDPTLDIKFNAETVHGSGAVGQYLNGVKYSYSFMCDPEDTDPLCTIKCKAQPSSNFVCNSIGQISCKPGWMGPERDCNMAMPCGHNQATSPCKNNGKCEVIDATTFTCHCQEGYWGRRCENYFQPCAVSPCKNGGTCQEDPAAPSKIKCDCRPGLIGTFCETDQKRCTSDLCQNGGTCIEYIGGFSCTCAAGFTGENCRTDIDECALQNPCVSGGTCVNTHGGFKCNCPTGVDGDWCQNDVDECETHSSKCSRDQTCVNTPGSYACVKTDGNDCDGVECSNGGTCVDMEFHYICHCLHGYFGPTCSVSSHHRLIENL